MQGMRKDIPKSRNAKKQICGRITKDRNWSNWETWYVYTNTIFRDSRRGSLIDGRFVFTIKNKPISVGHKKTGAYLDENRKLDAGFYVKGFREFAESNAYATTVQFQSIRLLLAVIAFRKWDFRAMDVSRAFMRSEPFKRGTYVQLPKKE